MAEQEKLPQGVLEHIKGFPFARISRLRIMGYTLYCSWVLAVFYSTFLYVSAPDFREVLYSNQIVSLIALALTLLLFSLIVKRADKWVLSLRMIIPSAVAMTLATALLIFADSKTSFGFALIVSSALISGVSSGFLFLGWARIFTDTGSRIAMAEMSISWVMGALICMVLVFVPAIASCIITIIIGIIQAALLRACAKRRPGSAKPKRKTILQKKNKTVFQRGLLAALNLGFVAGFSDIIAGYELFTVPEVYDIALLCGVAVFVLAALAIILISRHTPVMNVYRFTFFAIAIGCLTIPFMSNDMTYQYVIIFGGYVCFMIVLLVICINISSYFYVPAAIVCGIAFGVLYIGEALGFGVAYFLTTFSTNDQLLGIITFLLAGALLFANMFLFTEKDLGDTNVGRMTESDDDHKDIETLEETQASEVLSRIVTRYKLSARESEVLPLVYKGRTIARIQEELFISAGTVSTHIHHIYKKIGVKNRQELLDLIDDESKKV